jgi:hypothetical protein
MIVQLPQNLDRNAGTLHMEKPSTRYMGTEVPGLYVHHLMVESRAHVNMVMDISLSILKQCPEVQRHGS